MGLIGPARTRAFLYQSPLPAGLHRGGVDNLTQIGVLLESFPLKVSSQKAEALSLLMLNSQDPRDSSDEGKHSSQVLTREPIYRIVS